MGQGFSPSTSLAGVSASRIQTAINNDVGGMGQFSSLTAEEVQQIADALSPASAAPAAATDGTTSTGTSDAEEVGEDSNEPAVEGKE